MNNTKYAPLGRKWSLLSAFLIALTFSFSACKKNDDNTPTPSTINDLISSGNGIAGNKFTILKKAISLAGLSGALSQPGAYTVFAPTDAAFNAFGYADTNAIKAAPVALLAAVLQYHVIGSTIASSAIPTAINTSQQTLGGLPVYITKGASASGTTTSLSINGARIVSVDNVASNGVIHVIDRVLLPPLFGDITKTIGGIPGLLPAASFTFLQAAITKVSAGGSTIGAALTAAGPLTVFAPTNNAFRAAGYDSSSIVKASVTTLTQILSYHVVNGRIYTPLVTNGTSLTTAQTGTVTIGTSTTGVTVTGKGNGTTASNITGPDVTATNGVVHIIDRLLLPQ